MRRSIISPIVDATTARLTEKDLAELLERKDKRPTELVDKDRLARRRAILDESEVRSTRVDFERILGTNDLVSISYLARAQRAARSVCKVILRDAAGRELGSGSGFKVAPRILMTNHHVLSSAEEASTAIAEFNYELDERGDPRPTTRFTLRPDLFFLADEELDFAIVAISEQAASGPGNLQHFGFLRLIKQLGKLNPGEFVSIIQHPGGRPKQIALRENKVLSITGDVIWYSSDTAQGSSGAPVLNDAWQVVGLHHSGVPRTANGQWLRKDGTPAGPEDDDAEIDWIANEGIRCSRIVARIEAGLEGSAHAEEFLAAASGNLPAGPAPSGDGLTGRLFQARPGDTLDRSTASLQVPATTNREGGADSATGNCYEPIPGGACITVPISFCLTMGEAPQVEIPQPDAGLPRRSPVSTTGPGIEVTKQPIIDPDYDNREGFQPGFLGDGRAVRVDLPVVMSSRRMVRMEDGETVIPYQHFSIVMDRYRRMAIFTAANVDGSREARRPEPNRRYTRDALGGFGPHDREQWLPDPRIPARFQLSDTFYNRDRASFDKGHLVRRDAVCFGADYAEVQRANGDSYHITNCSPQVKGFNRSMERGEWGLLENHILREARDERLCIFSGPVLSRNDPYFAGVDDDGSLSVKIPRAYWKVIVALAEDGDSLEVFAFLLHQDLSNTRMEFDPGSTWRTSMLSMKKLQRTIRIEFPDSLVEADQYRRRRGARLHEATGLAGVSKIEEDADLSGLAQPDEPDESAALIQAARPSRRKKTAARRSRGKQAEASQADEASAASEGGPSPDSGGAGG